MSWLLLFAVPALGADADTYEVSDGRYDGTGVFQLASPELAAEGTWYAAVDGSHADGPLTFTRPSGQRLRVVSRQTATRLVGGVTFSDLLRIHGELPLYPSVVVEDEGQTALGDIRMAATIPFLNLGPVALAAVPDVILPSGTRGAYVSNEGGAGLTLAAGAHHGDLGWVANLGPELAVGSELSPGTRLGSGMDWGAGAHYRLREDQLTLGLELDGRFHLTEGLGGTSPAEAHVYGIYEHGNGLMASLGAGTGVVPGIGAPTARIVIGIGWMGVAEAGEVPDRDGDGIPDPNDACPKAPGPAKYDGCPDTDGDGLLDVDDRCPNAPGGFETMGCPEAAPAPEGEATPEPAPGSPWGPPKP